MSRGEPRTVPTDGTRRKRLHIALSIERFAFIPLRAPAVTIVVAALLAIAAFFGIERIRIDDSLGKLFRSDTLEFRQYQQVSHEFPSNEYAVLIVVEGKSLLRRES